MLMIVRLYPKTDLSRVWNYIENEIKEDSTKPYTTLYASQSEGMMNVGIILDVNKPNDIASFLTEDIVRCDEIHHTKTVPLLKPVFFRIPKRKPESIQRYLIYRIQNTGVRMQNENNLKKVTKFYRPVKAH